MRRVLLSVIVLALGGLARADDAPKSRLETKLFSVADLVIPIPDCAWPTSVVKTTATDTKPQSPTTDGGERLIKMVTSIVRPHSWGCNGGAGKMEFFELGCALVVNNTPDVLREVSDLLDGLRRLQDTALCTQVMVVSMPVGMGEQLKLKLNGETFLTKCEHDQLLKAVQGTRDVNVTQCPKVTTFDGQTASIAAGETRMFVSSIEATKVKGTNVLVPKQQPVTLGDAFTLCGQTSADGKFVNLRVKFSRTSLVGEVELVPVTTQVTPVFEGGSQGKPIPFTQFLEAPNLKTEKFDKTVTLPCGGTVVFGGWKESVPAKRPPTTSPIPYLNRLFKNTGPMVEREVFVVVTTNVIRTEEKELAPMPRCVTKANAPAFGPDTIATFSDVRLEAAFDEKTPLVQREGLLDAAREGYQKALLQDPKCKPAMLGLARYHARVGEREKSVEMYKKYLADNPNDKDVAHEVALAHARWKDWAGAVGWCDFALKIDPENLTVRKTKAFCLAHNGKLEKGFEVLCQVVPEAEARYLMACVLEHQQKVDDCRQQLALALKADPNFTPASEKLAELKVATRIQAPRAPYSASTPPTPAPLGYEVGHPATANASTPVEAPRVLSAHALKNVAAADAAKAVTEFATQNKLTGVVVVAEPASNTVLVSGDAAAEKRVAKILADIDVAPKQVVIKALVLEASLEFLPEMGLTRKNGEVLVLTEREVSMFQAALRKAKSDGKFEVLSRPQMQVADNQTGRVQIGSQVNVPSGLALIEAATGLTVVKKVTTVEQGLKLHVTPRISPKGDSVMLRTECTVTSVSDSGATTPLTLPPEVTGLKEPVTYRVKSHGAINEHSLQATVQVPVGGTVILSAGARKEKGLETGRETLVILTPHIVRTEDVKPAGYNPAPPVLPAPTPAPTRR